MLKYKIAACAAVFLAGLAAGWFLNSRLLPDGNRNAGNPPAGDSRQSRALYTEDRQKFFKPREYIKINRSYLEEPYPEEP